MRSFVIIDPGQTFAVPRSINAVCHDIQRSGILYLQWSFVVGSTRIIYPFLGSTNMSDQSCLPVSNMVNMYIVPW